MSVLVDGYWVNRTAQADAPVDVTGATGVKWTWYCPFEKCSIKYVGAFLAAATGAVTTGAVGTFYKTDLAGNKTALRNWANITILASTPAMGGFKIDLDAGVGQAYSGVRGAIDFPELLFGEKVTFETTLQGVDGTQSIVPFLVFLEKEADTR